MRIRGGIWGTIAVLSCFGLMACHENNRPEGPSLKQQDKDFATGAAHGHHAVIAFGELAGIKGDFDGIQIHGAAMADGYQEALDELKDVADDLHYDIPNTLRNADDETLSNLTILTGSAFDAAYINAQVLAHAEAEALFEAQLANGKNERLVAYARDMLPKIRIHKAIADSIQNQLEDDNSSGRISKRLKRK